MLRYHHGTPEGLALKQVLINRNKGIKQIKIEDLDVALPGLYDPDFDYDY